jgi:opacity protein-like surface antigen
MYSGLQGDIRMNNICSRLIVATVLCAATAGSAFAADGLVGFYVGAGAGQANLRIDQGPSRAARDLADSHGAWKGYLGVRPLSVIGAELSYFDLGSVRVTTDAATAGYARAEQRGVALYGVGYLPIPVPFLDVFGKAGVARTRSVLDGKAPGNCITANCLLFHSSSTESRFAWGAGLQFKLPVTGLAIRAEYEQFSTDIGKPHLVTAGVIWHL